VVQYAATILTKEMLIEPSVLQKLGSEQLAAVDWVILKHARLAGTCPAFPYLMTWKALDLGCGLCITIRLIKNMSTLKN
jgi:hypothetical protein